MCCIVTVMRVKAQKEKQPEINPAAGGYIGNEKDTHRRRHATPIPDRSPGTILWRLFCGRHRAMSTRRPPNQASALHP